MSLRNCTPPIPRLPTVPDLLADIAGLPLSDQHEIYLSLGDRLGYREPTKKGLTRKRKVEPETASIF